MGSRRRGRFHTEGGRGCVELQNRSPGAQGPLPLPWQRPPWPVSAGRAGPRDGTGLDPHPGVSGAVWAQRGLTCAGSHLLLLPRVSWRGSCCPVSPAWVIRLLSCGHICRTRLFEFSCVSIYPCAAPKVTRVLPLPDGRWTRVHHQAVSPDCALLKMPVNMSAVSLRTSWLLCGCSALVCVAGQVPSTRVTP